MSAEDFSDFDKLSSKDRPPLGPGAVSGSPADGSGNPTVNVSVSLADITGADDLRAIEALSGTGYLKRTGTNTWALAATVPWSDITGKPTTLAGYGIVDAQPLDGDLTAIAALTGTNTLYYRSGASTWSPVTIGSGITFSGGTLSSSGGGGTPAGASTQIQFNTAGAFDASASLTWQGAAGLFILGSESIGTPTATASRGVFRIYGNDYDSAIGVIRRASADNQGGGWGLSKSRGSLASPAAVSSGDGLGYFRLGGYDGSNWQEDAAYIGADATENWTGSARGTRFKVAVTPNGTTSTFDALFVQNDGTLKIAAYGAGFLKSDASGNITSAAGAGSGDFVGPAGATDNAIVRFDGTTGKLGQNSLASIDDVGILTAVNLNALVSASQYAAVTLETPTKKYSWVLAGASIDASNKLYLYDQTLAQERMSFSSAGVARINDLGVGVVQSSSNGTLSSSRVISVNDTSSLGCLIFERNADWSAFRIRDVNAPRYRSDFAISGTTHGLSINSYDDTGAAYTPIYFTTSKLLLDSPALQFIQYKTEIQFPSDTSSLNANTLGFRATDANTATQINLMPSGSAVETCLVLHGNSDPDASGHNSFGFGGGFAGAISGSWNFGSFNYASPTSNSRPISFILSDSSGRYEALRLNYDRTVWFPNLPLSTGLSIAIATKSFPLTINGTVVNVLCQ